MGLREKKKKKKGLKEQKNEPSFWTWSLKKQINPFS